MGDPDFFMAGEPEGFFDGWSAGLSGVDEQAAQPTRRQTRPNHRRTTVELPDFRMFLLNFEPTFQPSIQEGPGTPPGDPDSGFPIRLKTAPLPDVQEANPHALNRLSGAGESSLSHPILGNLG